ncbi:target of Nesh-SH3 [Excalfactoria chinensis]|uniref:target of Nesh-SH3 n=1 Tax=Excalfactoria chinensis TaxID=46218 RepID=UPI003B3A1128
MMPRLVLLLFCGYIAVNLGSTQKLPRVKRQSLKVQINATDDTVCMRYLRPSQNTKLQGFVLGYGSSFFSNQYIPLPSEGNTYINELDAEPRYLVSVRPARVSNNKKSCSGRNKNQKPLQLVVGTLTPTSVFLSWGILVNPQHDWTATSNCASDRFYTVRYREKDKDKKWVFQLCPVTETVVDNLKPNTLYEFGVKDNMEDSVWSKTSNHKTVMSNKKVNGQLQNMYKLVPSTQSQLTLRDNKKLVPVTIIKQVIQNRTQSKTSDSSSLPGAILVHLIVPGLNDTQQKLLPPLSIDDITQVSTKKLGKNETQVWPAESKTPEVQEISPQSLPASNEIHPLPSGTRIFDAPKSPLTELATQSPTLKSVSLPSADTREMEIAFDEMQPISSRSKPSGTTEVQLTKSASNGFLHVTSTPQTFTASEVTDAAGFTDDLEITVPVITTEPYLLETALATQRPKVKPMSPYDGSQRRVEVTQRPKVKPISPYDGSQRRVEVTQRWGLDSTSTASPKATRTMKATRRPRLKSTTPFSLTTQQTVTAFDDKWPVSPIYETSTIQEMLSSVPALPSSELDSASFPSLETTRPVMATQRPKVKPMSPYDGSQRRVEVTQRWGLDSTSTASPKATRTMKATRRPRLKSTTPFSLTTQQTVTAFYDTEPVLSSPVTPSKPEIADTGPATSESILESFTPKTSRPFQWPRVTLAPKEMPLTPSKLKPSAIPEVQHVVTAPKPPLSETKTSKTVEQQKATLAPKEAELTPSASKPRPPGRPKKPQKKPVVESFTLRVEPPGSTIAPKETPRIPSKPKPSPKPHIPQAEYALESVTFRTDQPKPTIVPKESHRIPSRPRISPSSEVPQTKPALEPITFRTEKPKSTSVPRETRYGPSKPKTSPSARVPPTRASPKESRRVTSKPRTSPSPDLPHTKPAPRGTQQTFFKPKPAPIPDASQRQQEIIPSFREPDTTMIPQMPERIKPTLAATEKQFIHTKPKTSEMSRVPYTRPAVHQTTPQPIITKTSTTTGQSRATMAPRETMLIPSKTKTSVDTEVPQTKPASKTTHLGSINLITVHVGNGSKMTLVPNETYQISPKPKTALTTEIPWLYTAGHKTRLTSLRPRPSDKSQARPALSRTTVAPARTKAPVLPKWFMPTTDDIYTPEDIARHIDMDVKKPLDYIDNWEKPFSATTSPRPQHPPIPHVRPTPMRRKPLPPNTVTGKPGIPAKPAGPTMPVKTGVPYKTPTAYATPEYYVDETVFSSSPTSETDSSGKPRYLAPHVKYMKKDDDVPCSITSSLEHFPQEEAGIKEEPTRPPQNPPTNLTVVTVEGCPTFVILDWEKPDNDTVTEYEVVSTENGATDGEKEKSIITTNQTHSTVENLKPDTSYEFHVKPRNPLGEGPSSNVVAFSTESADPRVSEPISMGKDAIWTEIPFNSDTYSECKGKQYVKRTWYKKFVGVQLCNSLRYKIYLSDSLTGKFYNIGDQRGHGEDHCQFVDSFLDGRTGQQDDLPVKDGFFRAVRQEPVKFGKIGGETQINYVRWYECGTSIPGKW